MYLILLSQVQTQTTVQEVSFTYNDTEFAFFQTSPNINQSVAHIQCINWGGNLSTITSAVEDSLLLYSIPDLDTTFTCHIGLKKKAGQFVWNDNNPSGYRKWGTLSGIYPLSAETHYIFICVRHRYRAGGVLSQGWLNAPCHDARNCYFCSKPGK